MSAALLVLLDGNPAFSNEHITESLTSANPDAGGSIQANSDGTVPELPEGDLGLDPGDQLDLGRALVRGDGIEQDVERGLSLIEAAARAGSGWAWMTIGDVFSDGEHTRVDAARAIEAYDAAALLGVPAGRLKIADLYAEGAPGLPADPKRALELYEAAVNEGAGTDAEVEIARGHLRGEFGDLSDPKAAIRIYDRLGEAGELDAQGQIKRDLGRALVRGDGVEQDVERGLAMIESAAQAGSGWAWMTLGDLLSGGEFADVDAARALEAYEAAIALGVPSGRLKIADLYAEGAPGLPADPKQALAIYEAAINEGAGIDAAVALARGHLRGEFGDLSDPNAAVSIYERLGEAGELDAQGQVKRDLGRALVRGDGVEQDVERGLAMIESAAHAGSGWAWMTLGDLLSDGEFTEADPTRAIDAYKAAVDLDVPAGRLKIAKLYTTGATGLPADPERALQLYQEAAEVDEATDADVALARGHLRGRFGALSNPEAAVAIFDALGEAGNLDAQDQIKRDLGRALVRGDVIRQDVQRGLEILVSAVTNNGPDDSGDVISVVIETPREERGPLQSIVSRSALSKDVSTFTETISTKTIDYEASWGAFSDLPPPTKLAVLTEAGRKDRNLFVGLLQAAMLETGEDVGKVDGYLGPKTISAYGRFCKRTFDPKICELGPFDGEARKEISQKLSASPAP